MHFGTQDSSRRIGVVRCVRRIVVMAAYTLLAFGALALPLDLCPIVPMTAPALAASGNSNAGGNGKGKGPEGAPGQQVQEDVAGAEGTADGGVESSIAETGGSASEPATLPIPEDAHAGAKVVKELAGLGNNDELSEEEELEAIRSGWGTWRTADGPETVIAQ